MVSFFVVVSVISHPHFNLLHNLFRLPLSVFPTPFCMVFSGYISRTHVPYACYRSGFNLLANICAFILPLYLTPWAALYKLCERSNLS